MNATVQGVVKARGRRPAAADLDGREHLLDCATRLFAEQGVAATTMAQIAAAGGVTSAMVHYYFRNRDNLLDVVVEERIMRAVEFVWQIGEPRAGVDPIALAHTLVDRLFDVTERMPWLPSLWLREIINEGGMLRERLLERLPLAHIRRFARLIGAGQKAGRVNAELEPALLFVSILALVMLPLATAKGWQRLPGMAGIGREMLHRHVMALLTHGLVAPAPAQSPDRAMPPSHAANVVNGRRS